MHDVSVATRLPYPAASGGLRPKAYLGPPCQVAEGLSLLQGVAMSIYRSTWREEAEGILPIGYGMYRPGKRLGCFSDLPDVSPGGLLSGVAATCPAAGLVRAA